MLVFALKDRNSFDHDFGNGPRYVERPAFGLDGALVFAMRELAFDKDVIAGLNPGRVVRRAAVCNTVVPLRFLLPLALVVLVTF